MVLQIQVWALNLMSGGGGAVSFDLLDMWGQMGWLAKAVAA